MKKLKFYLKLLLTMAVVFCLFFGIGAGTTSWLLSQHQETEPEPDEAEEAKDGKRTNILVLGVDARPGEENSRSDTLMVVSIDPQLDKVAVVSIPRDTRVKVNGSYLDKICAANFAGGPEGAVEAVEELMDIAIDNYIKVDFKGFEKIIDTLGGVTYEVPQRMYKPTENIDLYPGMQKLDGSQALALVRFRDYMQGDIERTAQQQAFIKALAAQVLQPKTITKLPKIIQQLNQHVDTDLKLSEMMKMASWAPGFNADSIITQTLPGYFYDVFDDDGYLAQSYWIADKGSVANLFDKMFAGETITVVQASPFPVNRPVKNTVETVNEEIPEEEEVTGEEEPNPETGNEDSENQDLDMERSNLPSPGHEDPATKI
ncbi:MAG: LCP family protein [Syntrophomonadaceae bacterium]|nr:LCP family protein [Syntrophomonadaceae bacterium]